MIHFMVYVFITIKKKNQLVTERKREKGREKQEGRKGQSQQLHSVYRDTVKHNSPEKTK